MKALSFLLLTLIFMYSCTQPAKITANPNSAAATSGTLGSTRASDGVRPLGLDSLANKDSIK